MKRLSQTLAALLLFPLAASRGADVPQPRSKPLSLPKFLRRQFADEA